MELIWVLDCAVGYIVRITSEICVRMLWTRRLIRNILQSTATHVKYYFPTQPSPAKHVNNPVVRSIVAKDIMCMANST